MEYFTEQGSSHREVMDLVQLKYGDNAKVLYHRDIRIPRLFGLFSRDGVEVTGYLSREPVRRRKLDIEDEKRKILSSVGERSPAAKVPSAEADKQNSGDKALQTILDEVKSLKTQLTNQPAVQQQEHPILEHIGEVLTENDFSPAYTKSMLERITRTFSMEDLKDQQSVEQQVMTWIGSDIELFPHKPTRAPEVFILVGPTGVGKTTTIAKLAAMYGLGGGADNTGPAKVRILTIDNYRIGARQQIETYGDIMGFPVNSIESKDEMKKYLAMYQDADMIFVDTIGKSPRDFERLGKMRALLDGCGASSSVHLGMSATTKTSDMQEILRQFEPFGYKSVVLTKLDETTRVGNIVSVLHEHRKQLSFVTYGQRVPQDIERASVPFMLKYLNGFTSDRGMVYRQFSKDEHLMSNQGDLHG